MLINFLKLPPNYIISFLNKININEKLELSKNNIIKIKEYYDNDIRSMINYMQSLSYNSKHIIDKNFANKLNKYVKNNNLNNFTLYINKLSLKYNTNIIDIIKIFINNIINHCLNKNIKIDNELLINLEKITHNYNCNVSNNENIIYIKYFFHSFDKFKNLFEDI